MTCAEKPAEIVDQIREIAPKSYWDSDTETIYKEALQSRIYGPYFRKMVQYGLSRVKERKLEGQPTEMALFVAAELYTTAEKNYLKNGGTLSDEVLATHQQNVLEGKIALLPAESATTIEVSIEQVRNANDIIRSQEPAVQAILAELNYSAFFTGDTMASGRLTLDRKQIDELLSTLGTSQRAMPHLTVSNWAIGQTVAGIYEAAARLRPPQQIRIFDIGSGSGGTIAPITNCIANLDGIGRRPELAITAIETTPELYRDLEGFVKEDAAAKTLELEPISYNPNSDPSISEYGAITCVKGDALEALRGFRDHVAYDNIRLKDMISDYTTIIVTANYSFHRIGSAKRAAIMRFFSKVPNIIFIIGDLSNNTSTINRRYFNLAANGPLNAGNLYLKEQFNHFFNGVDLRIERPNSLDKRLTNTLSRTAVEDDGNFWIAYRGRLTPDGLNLVPSN